MLNFGASKPRVKGAPLDPHLYFRGWPSRACATGINIDSLPFYKVSGYATDTRFCFYQLCENIHIYMYNFLKETRNKSRRQIGDLVPIRV